MPVALLWHLAVSIVACDARLMGEAQARPNMSPHTAQAHTVDSSIPTRCPIGGGAMITLVGTGFYTSPNSDAKCWLGPDVCGWYFGLTLGNPWTPAHVLNSTHATCECPDLPSLGGPVAFALTFNASKPPGYDAALAASKYNTVFGPPSPHGAGPRGPAPLNGQPRLGDGDFCRRRNGGKGPPSAASTRTAAARLEWFPAAVSVIVEYYPPLTMAVGLRPYTDEAVGSLLVAVDGSLRARPFGAAARSAAYAFAAHFEHMVLPVGGDDIAGDVPRDWWPPAPASGPLPLPLRTRWTVRTWGGGRGQGAAAGRGRPDGT